MQIRWLYKTIQVRQFFSLFFYIDSCEIELRLDKMVNRDFSYASYIQIRFCFSKEIQGRLYLSKKRICKCSSSYLKVHYHQNVQVNLCQKLLFLHQLTHNMTTDCSLNHKFNTWKFQAQTWGEHVLYRKCFWHSEQYLYTTCSPHVLQKEGLLTKIYL